MVGRAARFGRVEGHHRGHLEPSPEARDELAVPMVVGAQVIGVIQVLGDGVADLPLDTVDVVEALAVQAASAVASARLHEDTQVLARTDALTQLPNRRQLDEDLTTEGMLALRHGRPLCFAMVDVDHFKAYNDALGHQAGDVALQEVAALLAARGRTGDRVYRFGGEEIALLLRETDAAGGREVLERLRAAVEHHFSAPGQPRLVTISAGVAALPEHAHSVEALVRAADEAVYAAKRAGRNQVCVAGASEAGVAPASEPPQPV
jgi:diguanylate cyclase (GGDEF)-like protein